MLSRIAFIFLTLVGCYTLAAPHFDAPMNVKDEESNEVQMSAEKKENISITTPPSTGFNMSDFVTHFNKAEYYYPYRQEVSLHAGLVFGVKDSSDDEDLMNALVGFTYMKTNHSQKTYEIGADLSFVGHGHLQVSRRFIYNEKGSFRPWYSYGLINKVVPDEKFASFSSWDNYLLRAGVGLEDIMKPPRSVRLELYAAVGKEDVLVMFTYGYSWGF